MRNPTFTILAALVIVLPSFTVVDAWSAEPIDQSVSATADGTLVVENISGNVAVKGWDQNKVHVTGMLGEGAERVDVASKNGRVTVRVILPRNEQSEGTDLTIMAPRGSRLEISTVSADVAIRNIDGRQRISTVSGDIAVKDARAQLEIKSVSGDLMVSASGSATESSMKTVSGDVIIKGVSGRVSGKSVSGDVLLAGSAFREVSLISTSGDLRVTGSVDPKAVLKLKTISGDASIRVDGDITGEFDLRTTSGDIDNCFGPEPEEKDHGPGARLRFSEGKGGAEVRVTTMSGDIELCRD